MADKQLSPRARKLVLVGLVPVFGLLAWGMSRAPLDGAPMRAGFLAPYHAAVDARRYVEAWRDLTDDTFKRAWPEAAFAEALSRHAAEQGRIVRREEVGVHGFADVGGPSGFFVTERLFFERGPSALVVYRVVHRSDGSWRLDTSGQETSTRRPLTPGAW